MKKVFTLSRDQFHRTYSVEADDFKQLIEILKNFDNNIDICYSNEGCYSLLPYVALEYITAGNQSYDRSYVQKVADLADELYRVIHNPCNWANPPVILYQVATLTKVQISWESGYHPIV
ncbi:MAG: hypothetical protein PHU70_02905, partial [Dehalococcoidia bacterium]|nr:hypothetical protein [Dehalococcoidia bacterium]